MSKTNPTRFLVKSAVIAAIYVALTYLSGIFNLAYGSIQFRISEALTILPVFTPAAIPGLTVGCLLGNLASPFGLIDIILGTIASFIAAVLTRFLSKIKFKGLPILSPLPPVAVNALIIGAEIAFFLPDGFSMTGFLIAAAQVGLGQLAVCYLLGLPLYKAIVSSGANKFLED